MIQKQLTAGGKDLSQLVEKVTWSGDSKQVARKLAFSIATRSTDRFLPKVTINEGDSVLFKDGDRTLFGGPVFDIEKSASGNLTTYTAFDLMFYINNSDISKIFDDTPEAITAWICSHLSVPFGSAAPTGIKVYLPWLGKKAYEAIMAAYTTASRQNGKKYIPLMQNVNQVYVIEKGALCGVVLDGGYKGAFVMIKNHLSRILGERRMKQADLARITGIRPTTISELYNEVAERVSLDHLDKICEALNCTLNELLEYIPNQHRRTGKDLILEEHGNRKKKPR